MADVLIAADSIRSPEMRHEVPVPVPDPFVFIEHDGARSSTRGTSKLVTSTYRLPPWSR